MVTTSYEAWKVKDTVHVAQIHEVKPGNTVISMKPRLCSQQNHRISGRIWTQPFMVKYLLRAEGTSAQGPRKESI